jgi:hypothetical protein
MLTSYMKSKVQEESYDEALMWIYLWIKHDEITLTDFKELIQANRDSIY